MTAATTRAPDTSRERPPVTSSSVAPEGAYSFDIPIRIADLSPAAHISNVAFLRYVDEARMAFFGAALRGSSRYVGGLLETIGEVAMAVVARNELEYRREVFTGDGPVTMRLWIPYIGGSSFVLAGEAMTAGHEAPAMVFESTTVFVERTTGKTWSIDDPAREVLSAWGGPRPYLRGRAGL